MEIPCLECLLDSISQLRSLSPKKKIASDLAQRYFKDIDGMMKHLKTVLDEIASSGIALNDQLISLFEELSLFTNEACELVKSWKRMTSKIYMVIQVESVILKIQGSILEACSLLNSSLQSPGIHPDSQCIQQCIQKIQNMNCIKTSDAIKEVMRDLIKNRRPEVEHLVQIAESLGLLTSQELLMEAVMLDKLRVSFENSENHGEVEYINHMIALITYMHDRYVENCRRHSIDNVPIPADYCCPLSLELMSDPVIVASGQTYERVFIRKWLDQDINVCPKTRQMLSHTILIPNYTVKQLIAHWCEKNGIKIPDPSGLFDVKCSSDYLVDANKKANYSSIHQQGLTESNRNSAVPNRFYHEADLNGTFTSPSHSSLLSSLLVAANVSEPDIDRVSITNTRVKDRESCLEKDHVEAHGLNLDEPNNVSQAREEQLQAQNRSAYSSGFSHSSNSHSNGDLTNSMTPDSNCPLTPLKESVESQPRSTTIWQNHPERSFLRTASTPSGESRPPSLGIESQVHNLIKDLKSESIDVQRDATSQLRLLAKNSNENRIVIATCGAISSLVALLQSSDLKTQEHAVTALLNLSINDNNKAVIVNAGSVDSLIHVLRTGNPESKENAAATLFSLSVIEEHKIKIGRSGAIVPLVDLLANGTPRGKKDAATALFNLSICHENKGRIVQAGAVKHLVDLMDPAAGMVDKAVAVLANLSTTAEGRTAIAHEGGIPCLVEVVELGTSRGKENAAAALLQLCNNSNRFCSMVLQEGAVPPLVALSQSGTPRAKEKAQSLLSVFKNHRYGRAGRP